MPSKPQREKRPRQASARLAIASIALLVAAFAGCGAGTADDVIARVGGVSIDRSAVEHWADAIESGSAAGFLPGSPDRSPQDQALEFLISADWLDRETAKRHIVVTDRAVESAVDEEAGPLPGGTAELRRKLATTGQTIADARLEARSKLEMAMLRSAWSNGAPTPSSSDVATFYQRHLQLFGTDRRIVDLIEGIESRAQASALSTEIGTGSGFSKRAVREIVPRPPLFEAERRYNRGLVEAIFATPPGRIGGPVSYNAKWVLLLVRRTIPGPIKPFAAAKAGIAQYLAAERRRRALARFEAAFRERWKAVTSCRAGFVVPECGP